MTTTTVPTQDTSVAPPSPRVRRTSPRRIAGYVVLVVFAVIYLYPFLIQIATSLKDDPQATANPLSLIPNPFDLGAWKRMFGLTSDTSVPIMTWLGNSVLVTVVVTASRVFFDSLAGYALSRLHFKGRGAMFAALLAVMSVPGVVLLVPKFLIVTYLGIFDTYWGLLLPHVAVHVCFFSWIMKGFFDGIDPSMEYAAMIDGCSRWGAFRRVALPAAVPGLTALGILCWLYTWNEFLFALILTAHETPVLTVVMAQFVHELGMEWHLMSATGVLALIPALIVTIFGQKYVIRGLKV